MSAHDIREQMESTGYAGRWGNLLASIHTVVKRLHARSEIKSVGNVNGRDMYRWVGRPIPSNNAFADRMRSFADQAIDPEKLPNEVRGLLPQKPAPPPGSPGIPLPNADDLAQVEYKGSRLGAPNPTNTQKGKK